MTQYEALLKLQEVDIHIMRLVSTLNAMPQQKRLASLAAAQKKLSSQITKIVGIKKDAQMEVDDAEAAYNELLTTQQEIKEKLQSNNTGYREVSNIEHQLSTLAKKIEKIEFGHEERVRELEKAQKAEKNARELADKLLKEKAVIEASFKKDSAEMMGELRKLKVEHQQLAALLDPKLYEDYLKLSKRFDGLAVERLDGNIPSVCRVKLQPSAYGDLKRGSSIEHCPYCHRLLVCEDVNI